MSEYHPIPDNPRFQNLIGQVFGRRTVVAYRGHGYTSDHLWECLCECGSVDVVSGYSLKKGTSNSCGCLRTEVATTHGCTNDSEYSTWDTMVARCHRETSGGYCRYGARGIVVCERWRKFEDFLADMGKRPSDKHSIDRINNDGNYSCGKCAECLEK